MAAGQLRHRDVEADGGADAPDLVRGDGDSVSRIAEENAAFHLRVTHRFGDAEGVGRVVGRLGGVGAEILNVVAQADEVRLHAFLHFETGVIGPERDLHGSRLEHAGESAQEPS